MPHMDELDLILQQNSGAPTSKSANKKPDELDAILSTPSTQKEDRYKPTTPVAMPEEEDPGVIKSTMVGIGKGMSDIYSGIKQRALQAGEKLGWVEGKTVTDHLRELQDEARVYAKSASSQKHPVASAVGQVVGSAAALPIPPVFGGAAGGSALAAGARTAANTAVAGAAYGAVDPNKLEKPMLQAAGEGAALGAALGGPLGATGKVLANGMRGTTPTGSPLLQSVLKPTVPGDEQAMLANVAKETGLKPTFGELSQSPTALSTEQFLTGLPMSKMRSHKFESAAAMEPSVKTFIDQMSGKWADIPESSFINQLKGMEKSVKTKTDDLYTHAANAAKAEKLKPNPEPIQNFLIKTIDDYSSLPGKEAKKVVSELKDQLGHANNLTYDKVDFNIKYLSKLAFKKYKQAEAGTALPDEYKIFYRLRDTYLDSLDSPNASPSVKAAMNTAREFYKNEVVPFQDPKLQQFMSQEIAFDKFLRSMTNTAKAGGDLPLFKKLDPDAQQLLRKDFLGFIRNEATQADGSLDLNKFSSKLNQYSSLKPQIFGDEVKKFEAYAKLLNVMKPMEDLNSFRTLSGGTLGGIGASTAAVLFPQTQAVILPAAATLWLYGRMATSETGRTILNNLTKVTDKTSPHIRQALEKKGTTYYQNLLKNIPKMYLQNTIVNANQREQN